ncbi:alginate lyase family protein [Dyadobacter sp. UP-52]|uniref:Alginate lyase family protein n=2 Tax=Dyadobacter subterraneus TaxID=2773304 RepID=A0ABR9WPV5_9BACT|nr:alginate lyase family protein [Dyadobacter subterraneus]
MRQSLKIAFSAVSDVFQFVQHMGWRYTGFRIWYELQRRTGILKIRFPTNPRQKTITPEGWRNYPVAFFFPGTFQELKHQDYRALSKRVEKIHQNQFLYFNSKFYTVPDWLTNPENGFQYDISKHWTEIPDFSEKTGDIKYVWEKSRFTFLYDLIRYDHHFERDQSKTVFTQMESWIDNNPVNQGPNWRCSQEITLRVLNWTFALQYYKKSPILIDSLLSKILNSIHQQMRHVAENIHFSRIAVRNNHALTETLGLYLIGLLYPFFDESREWKRNGKKWFEEEIAYQIYDDGTFLQFSMNYHRVVVQLLTWAIQLAHFNYESWDEVVYDRARKSLKFLQTCQDTKTGWLPNYGNNDGALFFPLTDCHFRDYRPQLMALATVLGEKHNYNNGQWKEESIWLGLNPNITEEKTSPEDFKIFAFPNSGYYVLRDQNIITFLRCGSYQNRPFQSDNLHLDVWVDGENILRDAGSYQYNTDQKWTNYFSRTASHNTVMLGNNDQMRRGKRFIWYDWIKKSEGNWKEENGAVVFEGWFEGFKKLGKGIIHRRKVTKQKGEQHWIIEDWIENAPKGILMHQIWHPYPTFFEIFRISAFSKNGKKIKLSKPEGWYSDTYGEKERAYRIDFCTTERYIKTEISLKISKEIGDAHFVNTSVFP